MKHLRAALLGCGRIGSAVADDKKAVGIQSHAEAYWVCPDTELVAVADPDPIKLERAAARWSVQQAYLDPFLLLSEVKPELVSICSPNSSHEALLDACLNCDSVRGILLEKPIGLNLARVTELVDRAKKREVILAVNYSRRYSAGFAEIKKWIDSNELGAIQVVSGYYSKGLIHNGTHWIDTARYLLKGCAGEIVSVKGALRASQEKQIEYDKQTPDLEIQFESGARGFLMGLDHECFSLFEMDIVGTKGRLRIVDSGYEVEVFQKAESAHASGFWTLSKISTPFEASMSDLTLFAVQDLVRCVRSGAKPLCSAEEGLIALSTALTALSNSRESL